MTKPIKLIYWRDVPNLGDILSPYIVKALSKREIVYKNRWWGWKYYLKELWRIIIHRQWMDMRHLTHPFERVMLGVGSILKYANYNSVVWGAGFMNNHDTTKARNIIAVRGCLSASKVREGGGKIKGDPALLLPTLLPAPHPRETDCEVGFIPHWSEFDNFALQIFPEMDPSIINSSRIIDFRTTDIDATINKILNCRMILSSSLHGIIIAHAYGIPALWFRNPFKYNDYFSSVNIPQYEAIDITDIQKANLEDIRNLFQRMALQSIPTQTTIVSIQKDLIDTFPY